MNKLSKTGLKRTSLVIAYSALGTCLFYFVEKKPELNKDIASRLSQELKQRFIDQYNISMSDSDISRFVQDAYDIVKIRKKAEWTVINSAAFVICTLTTIGYGQITPETSLGQILTVVYCIPGLAIMMLTLKTLGEMISRLMCGFVTCLETKLLQKEAPRHLKAKNLFVMFILTSLMLCAGAVVEIFLDGWSFIEGFYTYFVTFSTIGFGDYIPYWSMFQSDGDSTESTTHLFLIMLALIVPYFGGLCLVSGVLTSLVEAAEEFRIHFKTCSCAINGNQRTKVQGNLEPANVGEDSLKEGEEDADLCFQMNPRSDPREFNCITGL